MCALAYVFISVKERTELLIDEKFAVYGYISNKLNLLLNVTNLALIFYLVFYCPEYSPEVRAILLSTLIFQQYPQTINNCVSLFIKWLKVYLTIIVLKIFNPFLEVWRFIN